MTQFAREAIITPLENAECETFGCEKVDLVADVDPDAVEESRTLCPHHRAQYLNEVYHQ